METIQLDPERQKKARQYARISRRLSLISMALSGAYALAWLIFRWGSSLQASLQTLSASPAIQVALFAAVFGGILSLISLPLDFYTGFSLPHRFGLSTQTFRGWIVDQLKGLLVGVPLGLGLLELVYALLRWQPDSWWIWVAAALIIINVLLANLAPVLLMPIFNKFVPLGEEYAELSKRLLRLAERAGAKVRGVYQFDMSRRTKAANAALTGLGNTRRIILGDTLLSEFSTDEIETVMAHELGHHANNDILLGIVVESAVTLVGLLLAFWGLRWGVAVFGFQGPADPAAMPLLVVVMGIYGLITMPLGNGFSRWREKRADQYALRLTGNGDAFASALTRLANQNLSQVDPEPWEEWLFYSHPSLGKRIAMAKSSTHNNHHGSPE
ncbi:MAG TPA: M48 family metallopeptidase [Anaerolineaceae bacterium]|nr:M48 family metallopeptidase [Anaerolineaceae bacterium]